LLLLLLLLEAGVVVVADFFVLAWLERLTGIESSLVSIGTELFGTDRFFVDMLPVSVTRMLL
jgi:hypothetical protein